MTLLTALRTAAACVLLLVARAAPAAEATYALDPVHTRVMFAVGHAGFDHFIRKPLTKAMLAVLLAQAGPAEMGVAVEARAEDAMTEIPV